MPFITNQVEVDLFKPNNYQLVINDTPESNVDTVNFLIQDVVLPGVNLNNTLTNYQNNQLSLQSNKLIFEQFSVNLIVNEDFSNYNYIFNWMNRITKVDDIYSEMRTLNLFLLNNNKNPIKEINLTGAWPTSLGSIPLQFSNIDTTSVIVPIVFAFQWMEFRVII